MRSFLSIGLLLALSVPVTARGDVPSQFSVQGVLRDSTGKLQSMMVNVTASLFDAQTAGNRLAGPFGPTAVMAVNGLFTLTIPDNNLLAELQPATQVWLEVAVGNDTFGRQLVTPEIYALMCSTADRIRGVEVAAQTPAAGQLLRFDGTRWTPSAGQPTDVGAYVVAGNVPNQDINPSGGAIAHMPFAAPADGVAIINWSVTVGLNGTSGSCDIIIGAFGAAKVPAFTDPYISYAFLPTYSQFQQLSLSGSAVLPVTKGANNLYLDGAACASSYFRRPVMTARFELSSSVTSGAMVVN